MTCLDNDASRRARDGGYAFRSLLERGVPLAFGTDWPIVADANPFATMRAAVTRHEANASDAARPWDAAQALSPRQALEAYGFNGPVEVLNRGWPVDDVLVHLVETYGRQSEVDRGPSIIVLMDWDRTGGRLQSTIRRNLESLDVRFDEDLRTTLMRCLKPETRVVEGLSGLVDALAPLVEMYDD